MERATDAVVSGVDFCRARQETIRYHEDLYASTHLGESGTWLAAPHPLLCQALTLLAAESPVTAYDLGAGVGRHTIPMLHNLPLGSDVYAVDLLQSALDRLEAAVPPDIATVLHTVRCDLDDFVFDTLADLVVAFSAIEHLPDTRSVRALLQRIAAAIAPGGVVAVGVAADRVEIHASGRRPALLESGITSATSRELLTETFTEFTVEELSARPAEVLEDRAGQRYTLRSTLITMLARRR